MKTQQISWKLCSIFVRACLQHVTEAVQTVVGIQTQFDSILLVSALIRSALLYFVYDLKAI